MRVLGNTEEIKNYLLKSVRIMEYEFYGTVSKCGRERRLYKVLLIKHE